MLDTGAAEFNPQMLARRRSDQGMARRRQHVADDKPEACTPHAHPEQGAPFSDSRVATETAREMR